MTYLLLRFHRWILGLGAAAALVSLAALIHPGLHEEYSIEGFVASDDEAYDRYLDFMHRFVSNELAIIAVRSDDALSLPTLTLLDELGARCSGLEGVQRVSTISQLPDLAAADSGLRSLAPKLAGIVSQLLDPRTVLESVGHDPTRAEPIRRQLLSDPLVVDNLISRDGRTTAVLIQVAMVKGAGHERKRLVDRLRRITDQAAKKHPHWQIVLAGPAVTTVDMIDYLHKDLTVFSVLVLVLICVSLGIIFRRSPAVVVPTLIGASAAVGTLGLSIACDMKMSLITQLLVVLTTILAVANCVHIIVAYQEFDPGAPRTAAEHTTRRMIGPTFAACATTAAGFGSVGFAHLLPFKQFAVLMACGVMFAWLMGISAVSLYGRRRGGREPARSDATGVMARLLPRSAEISESHRGPVLAVFGLITLVSAFGATRLRYESDFLKNFRPDSSVRRSYAFLGRYLAPVGSLEAVVTARRGETVLSPEVLQQAARFGREVVEAHSAIPKAMSLADLAQVGGLSLPSSNLGLTARMKLLERIFGSDGLANFISADQTALRINFRASEGLQVAEKLDMAAEVRRRGETIFGPSFEVEVTGIYPFYAHLIAGLLHDQNVCFALAVTAVFGLMWLSIGSLSLAVICMVPNLLPIVFCLGVMGLFGISVNMATAMILSVSIGIAVDSALHYAWRYRREVRAGHQPRQAMLITHATVGKACVFTHIVVVGGFWVLCLSEFLPTAYFGGLIGVTMIGALACDLFLLPMMLLHFKPVYKSIHRS